MNRQISAVLITLAAFIGGFLGYRAIATAPTMVDPVRNRERWTSPDTQADLESGRQVWAKRNPLGSPPPPPPPPPAPPPPPPPPPAVPAGVVKSSDGSLKAIFRDPAMGEVTLAVGGALPTGGKVTRITDSTVEWVDGKGQKYKHTMLADAPPFNTYAKGFAPVVPPPPVTKPASRKMKGHH